MFINKKNLTYRQRQALDRQLGMLIMLIAPAVILAILAIFLESGSLRNGVLTVLFFNIGALVTGTAYRFWHMYKLERERTEYDSY